MEVTSIGWLCGGLILVISIVSGIWFLFVGDTEEAQSAGCGGPGCLVIIVIYLLIAQPENPFIVPASVPPAVVSAPTTDENKVSRPDYLLSPPADLELDYNSGDGSGRISWQASRWMPTNPTYDSKIEYEIFVHYPDNRMGPYSTEKTSYHFDYLNADNTGGVRIEVKAVGIIQDEKNTFRYKGGVVKTSWTPKDD